MARQYKKGKRIKTVAAFEKSECTFFMIFDKTTHRAWIESWQYRTLKKMVDRGAVFEAKKIQEVKK